MAKDLTFEITDVVATLSETQNGWSKKLAMVGWNGKPAKYDIRTWAPNYERMGKGVSFTKDELKVLRDALNKLDLG